MLCPYILGLNKTESAVFLYCRFSLFLKDPSFLDYLGSVTDCVLVTMT